MLKNLFFVFLSAILLSCNSDVIQQHAHYENGFEEAKGFGNADGVQSIEKHSGSSALEMKADREWGPTFQQKVSELPIEDPKGVLISLWIKPNVAMLKALLVVQVDSAGVNKFWEGKELGQQIFVASEWQQYQATLELKNVSPDDEIKIFIWNIEKEHLFVDDWEIHFTR